MLEYKKTKQKQETSKRGLSTRAVKGDTECMKCPFRRYQNSEFLHNLYDNAANYR